MARTFKYGGRDYPVMTLNEATEEFWAQKVKGRHMAIIKTSIHGGKPNEFIVVEAEYGRPRED